MRKILQFWAISFCALSSLYAQQDSATYVSGQLSTEFQNNITLADEGFGCSDTLTVSIPAGNYVTGVDVYYQIEAPLAGNGWVSEQGSYLQYINTLVKENAVSFGDPNWDSAGVFNYARTGLNIANGLNATGQLQFFLHGFRTFGNPFCGTNIQRVIDSTWKIVVHHIPAPTCTEPSVLAVGGVTRTSVSLNWTTGGATAWQVGYRTAGSTGPFTVVNASSNPFAVGGLTAGQAYEFQVRDSCGVADVSFWHGAVNAVTLCNPVTAPFTETFDGANWISGAGGDNVGDQIDLCWLRPAGNPNFSLRTGGTISGGSGPSGDFNGGRNYIYTEASNGALGAGEITSIPVYIPNSMSKPQLRFYYHMFGADITSLEVQIDNGSGFGASILTINGQQQAASTDAWLFDTLGLSAFKGDTVLVKFLGTNSGFNGDIAIDEFSIAEAPSCFRPDSLVFMSSTASSVQVSWISGGASNWMIGYRINGTSGALTTVAANSNPFVVGGLTPGTSYEFFVRDSCSSADISLWSPPTVASTLCNPVTAPYLEDFNGAGWTSGAGAANAGNIVDACWQKPVGNPNFGTRAGATTSGGTGPTGGFGGTGNYLFTESSNGAVGAGEITSIPVYIPNTMSKPQLKFYYHMFGPSVISLEVQLDNGSGFGASLLTITGAQQTASADPWLFDTLGLSAYKGDTVQIKFLGTNNGFLGDIAIDEFSVDEAPTCFPPDTIYANNATPTTVELGWLTGGASNWLIGYRPAGTSGALTIVAASTNPFIVSGLTAATTYDFYIKDSCGVADVSDWSSLFTASTSCSPVTAPYSEDFNGAGWTSGAGAANAGNIVDVCWQKPVGNPNFGTRTGPTTSVGTGPSGGFGGTGNYLFTESSNGAVGTGEVTSIPIFIPNSMSKPQLKFYYHMFGPNVVSLEVQLDNGSGFGASLLTITGAQQAASADAWLFDTLGLSTYKGDTVLIKFLGTNTGFLGDIAIDEFSVDEAPTCFPPDTIYANNATPTTVELGWLTGGASNWLIGYRPTGTSGALTIVAASTNPFTVPGLTAATVYDFYIKDSCGLGDVSDWSSLFTAGTTCNPFTAPWLEDFNGGSWVTGAGAANANNVIDYCWDRPSDANPNFGTGTGGTATGTTGPSSGNGGAGNYVYTEASFGATGTGEIITPWVIVSNSITSPALEFFYHMYGANITTLEVQIDNGSGFGATLKTITGQQQTGSLDAWLSDTLDLLPFQGDTIRVKFSGTNGGLNGDIAIDDVSIDEAPACLAPQNLALDYAWINSASITWQTGGSTSWQLEYGATGFTLGSGTLLGTTNNPAIVGGLTTGTTYDVYVRDSCGPGAVSAWIGPLTFTTLCTAIASPFTENFDGTAWTTGGANTALGTIETCWERYPTAQFAWKTGPAPFPSTFTGTANDHTTGSDQFIYSERITNNITTPVETYIQSPPIILSGLTNPQLTFWYHMYGNSLVGMDVDINNGSGWTVIYTKVGQQQTSGTDPWREAIVNLASYIGDTVVVRFKSTNNNGGTNNDVSVDDVSIDDAPSCPKPQDVTVIGYTNTTATIGWTAGGTATSWNIEYGAPGFTPGTGTYVSTTTNPFTVTALSPNTAYEFYVRDSCGMADVSEWVGPDSATTDCNPVLAPLSEDFDGAAWTVGAPGNLAACWQRNPQGGYVFTPGQNGTVTNNTGPSGDHTSGTGKYLYSETYFNFGGFNPNVAVFTTPLVDLTPLTTPELKFYYHLFGGDIDSLQVRVFDGTSWTVVQSYLGAQQTSSNAAWLEQTVDLSAFAAGTVKVEFRAIKAVGNSLLADMAIDDVSIDEKPLCPKPTNFAFVSATTTTIDLSWITGGATNWVIEYGVPGFTPGTGTIVAAGTNPYTVTSLTPSTTYDFYIRDFCSLTSLSDSVGPVTASTLCGARPAPYSENFDGLNFDPGPAGFGVAGTIDPCWTRNTVATYFWKPGPSTPQTNGTGSSIGDHTSGSGQYLFTEAGGFVAPPLNAEATTPSIDLSPLAAPELRYWYHMFGPNVNDLYVEVSNDGGLSYSPVDTLSGNQQTSQASPWLEAVVDLSTYVNDTIIVKFRAEKTSNGNQSDISIDDITIDEVPSCPKPSNISTTASTSSSITLDWVTGGATNWQVEYGLIGFTQGAGTFVSTSTKPLAITALSPNTGYCFFVRDSCGPGDFSEWVKYADTTKCAAVTVPWSENFDGADWISGFGGGNGGNQISLCWDRPSNANPNFGTRTGVTNSGGAGPNTDVSGTGNYIYTEASGGATGAGSITTLDIDIPSTVPAATLTFSYHMFGADIDSLVVSVSNGGAFASQFSVVGQQQTSSAAPWNTASVDLSAFIGNTIQIRFEGTNSGFNGDIAIDELAIDTNACSVPTALLTTANGQTSITIDWTTGGASDWLIGYRQSGTTGPLTIVATNTSPSMVTGLNPSSSYDFYVKDSCGAGDVSDWAGPLLGSTLCGVATAPWTENFNSFSWVSGAGALNAGNAINSCWSRPSANNPNFSTRTGGTNTGNSGPSADVSGTGNYLYTEASNGATGTGEITSPLIYIPTSLVNPRLKFSYHMFGADITSLAIQIDIGGGFGANVVTLNGTYQTASTDAWNIDSVSLSTYAGDTIRIKFLGTNTGFDGDVAIDEVGVIADPVAATCADPTNLALTLPTISGFTVNWVSSVTSQLEVVLAGQPQGSGTTFNNVTSPYAVTNLTPNTLYDVYVRDSCSATLYSLWITDTISTLPCAPITASFNTTTTWLQATFNSGATTNSDSLYWSFGDGNNSSMMNPLHTYLTAGTYVVTMDAFSSCGPTGQFIDTIQVCDTLLADFVSNAVGDTVFFDASTSTNATSYSWSFNGAAGSGVNPSYVFPSPGIKPITLTAYNDCGDSVSITKNVNVCLKAVADWTYTIISTTSNGMLVQFDGSASQNAVTYEWDFGDGSPVVTGQLMPQHTYLTPGLFYRVCLKVTNTCNEVSNNCFRLNEVGIEELDELSNVQIYPNPASNLLTLEWQVGSSSIKSLEMTDVSGKKVLHCLDMDNQAGNYTLNVSELSAGTYVLKITTDNGSLRKKVVIE